MIPTLMPKNLFKDAKDRLSAFFGKAYLLPFLTVETLGIFVVIALWSVFV